jgi:hypothetical protein
MKCEISRSHDGEDKVSILLGFSAAVKLKLTDVSEVRTASINGATIVLMMEAERTSETSVIFNLTTRCYIPEDSKLEVIKSMITRKRNNQRIKGNYTTKSLTVLPLVLCVVTLSGREVDTYFSEEHTASPSSLVFLVLIFYLIFVYSTISPAAHIGVNSVERKDDY